MSKEDTQDAFFTNNGGHEDAVQQTTEILSLADLKQACKYQFSVNDVALTAWNPKTDGRIVLDLLVREAHDLTTDKYYESVARENDTGKYLNKISITLRGSKKKSDLTGTVTPGTWYCSKEAYESLNKELCKARERQQFFKEGTLTGTDKNGKPYEASYVRWAPGQGDERFPIEFILTGEPVKKRDGTLGLGWKLESTRYI
jgi:hypothetical protein